MDDNNENDENNIQIEENNDNNITIKFNKILKIDKINNNPFILKN